MPMELRELARVFAIEGDVRRFSRESRISPDALMALALLRGEGTVSPGQISARLSFVPSKTTRHIELLLRYRLIDEALDPSDLRRSLISATPRGLRLVAELERTVGAESLSLMLDYFIKFRAALVAHNARHPECRLTDGKARLLALAHVANRPLSISELARYASLNQPSVSMMVKWLIANELMEYDSEAPADGRIRRLRLSRAGQEEAREIVGELEA